MFGKKDIDTTHMETIIGPDTRFMGNIRSKGFVRIDGAVEGGVSAEGVILGEKGSISGDILAKVVFISGKVTGNVTAAHSLELQPKGQIRGDLKTAQLSIADGALFEGHCLMTAEKIGEVAWDEGLQQNPAASPS
ncbi:MAG: polymer-forming cytoskeletal protein [Elusimicrobia bacterium]|nr:polymer-forming cytoskeletal protein [Elusimicrobiota bacterium]